MSLFPISQVFLDQILRNARTGRENLRDIAEVLCTKYPRAARRLVNAAMELEKFDEALFDDQQGFGPEPPRHEG